jgi:hypothetical protein
MGSASTKQISAATRQWLKPAIHILLKGGVTWREFAELAKSVYVEVASTRFGKRGRPTNVSRTAVLTGLTRRDVRRQREILAEPSGEEPSSGYVSKGCMILAMWHLDSRFLDAHGKPAVLPTAGEGATFETLMRSCASDVRATTLLEELRSAGAVRVHPDGQVEALSRTYIPAAMDEELIRLWGTVLADVAATYVHNMTRRKAGKGKMAARFERQAVSKRVAVAALPEFQAFLNREGQAFLERVDAWLSAHEVPDSQSPDRLDGKPESSAEAMRLGVGMYHIQD